MIRETLSLADLTRAVAGTGESDRVGIIARRIRHWTLAGALPTAGPRHSGSGKHRRYTRDAAYVATILNHLANFGLSIGALTAVSDEVSYAIRKQESLWHDAVAGRQPIYLFVLAYSARDDAENPIASAHLLPQDDMLQQAKQALEGIILNLTSIFKETLL
jgi:DNA-binding transcriptional MerR regulator